LIDYLLSAAAPSCRPVELPADV